MQARGALMIEHRLIERMVALIGNEAETIIATRTVDSAFVDAAVDFIIFYADKAHHGKEEDILFDTLGKRILSDDDRRIMHELIEEHKIGRQSIHAADDAHTRLRTGDTDAWAVIARQFHTLAELYPRHIEKEDKVFFPASRKYLSDEEDQAMVERFQSYDQHLIHDKYLSVLKGWEDR